MIARTIELLSFDKVWRFKSPGPIPQGVVRDFYDLIEKMAAQGDGVRLSNAKAASVAMVGAAAWIGRGATYLAL